MDPCPFLRIVIGNLALDFPEKSNLSSSSYYCKFKLKGFPSQLSDQIPFLSPENDAVESRTHACFSLSKPDLDNLAAKKQSNIPRLKIEVYRRSERGSNGCGFLKSAKLLGSTSLKLDFKNFRENNSIKGGLIQNGWIFVNGGSKVNLHLNVSAEPDPRFVFQFDGEPECSPQIFQVNGNVRQPVFTCKFSFRNSGEISLRSKYRSSLSAEPSNSTTCFCSNPDDNAPAGKERKGWSITVHDLSGAPVAAASMVTPFVPSPGSDSVSSSNPGAWLILRPGRGTWKPWGRLEAWRECRHRLGGGGSDRLGYRFGVVPNGGGEPIPLADSGISTEKGGNFNIDITTGTSLVASPESSLDFGSSWGSGSDFGSVSGSGSGSWAHLLYRGFVMSSTVEGGKAAPVVEVGVQHVTCTEDAAVFVALAAAVDLSMDACRLFSEKLRKELRQPGLDNPF